jgi:hypothetical protein
VMAVSGALKNAQPRVKQSFAKVEAFHVKLGRNRLTILGAVEVPPKSHQKDPGETHGIFWHSPVLETFLRGTFVSARRQRVTLPFCCLAVQFSSSSPFNL